MMDKSGRLGKNAVVLPFDEFDVYNDLYRHPLRAAFRRYADALRNALRRYFFAACCHSSQ